LIKNDYLGLPAFELEKNRKRHAMSFVEQYGTVHNDKNAFTLPLILYRYKHSICNGDDRERRNKSYE
jgi:hypothetical protein